MPPCFTLREARSEDQSFLFRLYSDVRGPEVSAWGWPSEQREAFLRMQFDARSRSWQAAYPDAIDRIVICDSQPIGRRLVAGVSEGSHLIDVALLAPWRNRGIGSLLLRQLMEECAARQRPLSLHVLDGSPAQRLYSRMGFEKTETSQIYIVMRWTPGVRELSQRLPAR